MVHKKYTYKNGKRFGPYYYETKRVDGNVVTTYLGTSLPHKKIHLSLIKNILLVFAFVLLIASTYFISSNLTGNVSLDIDTNYNFGEQINGNLELNLLEGELVPADSIVVVNYGDLSKEFILSDLISNDKIDGDFYAQDVSISGNGLGYGIPGKITEYPTLDFEFLLEEASEELEESVESEQEVQIESEGEDEPEPESSSITGAVISDSNIISGTVSKDNSFSYNLDEGNSASLVSGSVYDNDIQLDDDVVNFDSSNNEILVTTDYSVEREGFGPDYIGKNSLLLNIDISSFELTANSENDFSIKLIYNDVLIVEASDHISVSGVETSNSESESGSGLITNENSNVTISNTTGFNQTINNETISNETFVNEIVVNFTESNYTVNVSTIQYGAVIGRPVRWVKTVSLETSDSLNLTLEIPASAENVKINKITDEDAKEAEISDFVESDIFVSITGEVTADFELERESFIDKILKLFRFTGRVIEEETETQEISVEVLEEDVAVEVEYYTGAPTAVENIVKDDFKTIIVSSPEDIHYENVLVYTNISDELGVNDASSIRIEWVENQSIIGLNHFEDYNEDGNIDYIEWVAPHLSDQTFNIIVIIDAVHLDSNRTFISNIYNETYALDDIWSETIPDSHFVRIKFEQPLNSDNDITIYPRIISGTPIINVYTINGNTSIAQFNDISNNSYNKIYLNNLTSSEDDFDLEIIGGEVQFDHIIDPTILLNGPAGDFALGPLGNESFVLVYVNDTSNRVQFVIKNTNGSDILGPITVANGTNTGFNAVNLNFTRVAIAAVNSTSFVIGWTNRTAEWRAGYSTSGNTYFSPISTDGSIGTSAHDIALTAFNSTLIGYCFTDFTEGDSDMIRFSAINGALIGSETDVNAASLPEGNLSNIFDCVAINSTTVAAFDYDAGTDDDATYHLVDYAGTEVLADLDIDAAVGISARVAVTNLDNNKYVLAWYDQADQDITVSVNRTFATSIMAVTDVDTAAGTSSRVALATVRNSSTGLDNFVVVYYNQTGTDIVAVGYNGSGTKVMNAVVVDSNPSTIPMVMAALGSNRASGMSLCPGTWMVAYTNATNRSTMKSYWLNGSVWDGECDPLIPFFGAFNESPLNNTPYVANEVYRFNISVINSNGTVGFEFNGTNRTITNLTEGVYNSTLNNLAAGTYSYYWWSYGVGATYNISGIRNYVVARNSTPLLNLTLNGTAGNVSISNGSTILLNSSLILGDSSAAIQLYVNGTLVNQGATQVSNQTLFASSGLYNITAIYLLTQNYSTNSLTYYVNSTFNAPFFFLNVSLIDNRTYFAMPLVLNFTTNLESVVNYTFDNGLVNRTAWRSNATGTSFVIYNHSIANGNYLIQFYAFHSGGILNDSYSANITVNSTTSFNFFLNTSNGTLFNSTYILTPINSNASYNFTSNNYSGPIQNGYYQINIIPPNTTPVQRIYYNSVFINGTSFSMIDMDYFVNGTDQFDNVFAFNSYVNSSNATITINASSNSVMKCALWNFTGRNCMGTWITLYNGLTPGQTYNLTISPGDPGYGEINITNATHLNASYFLISNVYNEVYLLDDVWSEKINHSEYVRVTFTHNLTSDNDIKIYPRNVVNKSTKVEVYNFNSTNKLAEFPVINDSNGLGYYTIYLTNLSNNKSDTFDLKIVNLNNDLSAYLEFDHIIDPIAQPRIMAQTCRSMSNSSTDTYENACSGTYPSSCPGDKVSCNDGTTEDASMASSTSAGINISAFNSSVINCKSINDVFLCYEWWVAGSSVAFNSSIYVDANGGASFTNTSANPPNGTANPGVSCINVTSIESWTCGNFFGASGTRALARTSSLNGDPSNYILSHDVLYFNVSYTESDSPNVFGLNSPANGSITTARSVNLSLGINDSDWINGSLGYLSAFVDTDSNFSYENMIHGPVNFTTNGTFILNYSIPPLKYNSTQGMFLLYHFDNNSIFGDNMTRVVDYATGAFNGSFSNLNGGRERSRDGLGMAYEVDSSEAIILNDNALLNSPNITGEITVSLWFNLSNNVTNDGAFRSMVSKQVNATNRDYLVVYENASKTIAFSIGNGTVGTQINTNTVFVPNTTWYHYAVTYIRSSRNATTYVNGVVDKSSILSINSGSLMDTTASLGIGGLTGAANNFQGLLDDIAIFNKSLTAAEILDIYRLREGVYHWRVNVSDNAGAYNVSPVYTFTVGNSPPYNGTAVVLNSTLGLNRTLEDLNVRTTLLDLDNNTMNVTVKWYNNSVLHLTQTYNNSYANGSTFNATLDDRNTTKGHNWTAQLVITDPSASFTVNSSTLMIRNTPPNGTLTYPGNGTTTINRTDQAFTTSFSDDDGDGILGGSVNISLVAGSTCTDPNYDGSTLYELDVLELASFQISDLPFNGPLNCLIDAGDFYRWSVRASDGENGSYAGPFNLNVAAYINIVMNISQIQFGNLGYLMYNDTSDNSPQPLIMVNQGNAFVDAYLGATKLWRTVTNPSQYFQYKFANATTNGISENGSFDWANSVTVYDGLYSLEVEPPLQLIDFNYFDETDTLEVDINVTVPPAEGPGFRNTSIVFTIELAQSELG